MLLFLSRCPASRDILLAQLLESLHVQGVVKLAAGVPLVEGRGDPELVEGRGLGEEARDRLLENDSRFFDARKEEYTRYWRWVNGYPDSR
jgi:hypothetical protein